MKLVWVPLAKKHGLYFLELWDSFFGVTREELDETIRQLQKFAAEFSKLYPEDTDYQNRLQKIIDLCRRLKASDVEWTASVG